MSLNDLSTKEQEAAQRKLIETKHWHTCLNCSNYAGLKCNKFNADIPDQVLVVGCEHWFNVDVWDDDIPF